MKIGKKRWQQFCNHLMYCTLFLLGFTSCDNVMNGDEPCSMVSLMMIIRLKVRYRMQRKSSLLRTYRLS